jgi:hypothetical protein
MERYTSRTNGFLGAPSMIEPEAREGREGHSGSFFPALPRFLFKKTGP